jgi:hypothetical protein
MHATTRFRLSLVLRSVVAACALATAACDDDTTEPEDEPEVQTLRLVIGTTTYNIDKGTGLTGSITLPRSASTITATFLRADGTVESLVSASTFELRITFANTALATFARTGAFTGTITGVAAGTTTAVVQLFHLEEQHADFERTVNVTVQ